jgi:hypothetical protein
MDTVTLDQVFGTDNKSLLLLLKAGQWEDALILGRSLYDLDLNLSKISDEADPEAAAKQFVKFGKFLLLHLSQRRLQDGLREGPDGREAQA